MGSRTDSRSHPGAGLRRVGRRGRGQGKAKGRPGSYSDLCAERRPFSLLAGSNQIGEVQARSWITGV